MFLIPLNSCSNKLNDKERINQLPKEFWSHRSLKGEMEVFGWSQDSTNLFQSNFYCLNRNEMTRFKSPLKYLDLSYIFVWNRQNPVLPLTLSKSSNSVQQLSLSFSGGKLTLFFTNLIWIWRFLNPLQLCRRQLSQISSLKIHFRPIYAKRPHLSCSCCSTSFFMLRHEALWICAMPSMPQHKNCWNLALKSSKIQILPKCQ